VGSIELPCVWRRINQLVKTMNKEHYKWFYDHVHSRYYNLMIKWILLPFGGEAKWRRKMIEPVLFRAGQKILEMCCGTGGATLYISQRANDSSEIIGMDVSSGQLSRAKKRTHSCPTHFIEADVTQTGYDDNSFDKVFVTHAIHEMPRELRLTTLQEARRVVKQDGEVIVLELDNPPSLFLRLLIGFWFFYWFPGNFETATRRDMLKHGLVNEAKEAGLTNVRKYSALQRRIILFF
jgi:demethylmenaquinone methyltransferase/2-methoxy-6-polyprenyl-1,4-benzoquinol methylase